MKKEVKTSLLNISYEEKGNENSPVIVFVHGFPDDAQTWNVVTSDFIKDGYRTLSPYLRGYGSTRFHSEITMRSAQYMALVTDLADFVNALHLRAVTTEQNNSSCRCNQPKLTGISGFSIQIRV
jgi:pimeloyl-ACP methyl ester carboxylesterase